MPGIILSITGDIQDFSRIDNVYTTLKRESEKLLRNGTITINIDYTESFGTAELPQ